VERANGRAARRARVLQHGVFQSHGRHLLTAWNQRYTNRLNAMTQIWDAHTLRPVGEALPIAIPDDACFSRDGRRVAVADGTSAAKEHSERQILLDAIEGLGRIGGPAAETAQRISARLTSDDASLRLAAATALWRITSQADASLQVLLPLLQHSEPPLRAAAARTLGEMGVAAESALPELRAAIERQEDELASRTFHVTEIHRDEEDRLEDPEARFLRIARDAENRIQQP
jgi:hypothetical protein